MDFQSSPEDCTKVVRMREELDLFVQRGRRLSQPDFTVGGRTRKKSRSSSRLLRTLDFDMDDINETNEEGDKKKTQEIEVDLIAAKGKIIRLESELQTRENDIKRIKLESDRRSTDFKIQLQKDENSQDDMARKFKVVSQNESSLKEDLEEAIKEISVLKEKLREQESRFMKERTKLLQNMEEVKEKATLETTDMKERLNRKFTEAISYNIKLDEANAREELLRRKITSMVSAEDHSGVKFKLQNAEHRVKELEDKLSRIDEGAAMSLKLQSDLSRLKEVEKQNQRLKDEVQVLKDGRENNLLLQEKCYSAQEKLQRTEARIMELQKLEVENEELKKKIKSWEVEDETGAKVLRSPQALTKQISALQKSQILMKEEIGQLTAEKAIHENALKNLLEKYTSLKEEYNAMENKESQGEDQRRRLKQMLFLVTADRDSIRNVFNSVEQEISGQGKSEIVDRVKEAEQRCSSYQKEVENLQRSVDECKEEISKFRTLKQKLETELEVLQVQLSVRPPEKSKGQDSENKETRDKVERLQKDNLELEKKVLMLEAELETKKLKGCFDPSKTKVLHMAFNPYSKTTRSKEEELKQLRAENDRLKAVVASNQGTGKAAESSDDGVSYSPKVVKELNAQLESAQLKHKRLHEAFRGEIKQFREACYQLFGYRIDVKPPTKYQLFPMYADSPEDFFLFQYDDGELQMVETSFSKQCKDSVEMFLFRGNSIPAFLSAVTTEQFAKQTVIMDTSLAKAVRN